MSRFYEFQIVFHALKWSDFDVFVRFKRGRQANAMAIQKWWRFHPLSVLPIRPCCDNTRLTYTVLATHLFIGYIIHRMCTYQFRAYINFHLPFLPSSISRLFVSIFLQCAFSLPSYAAPLHFFYCLFVYVVGVSDVARLFSFCCQCILILLHVFKSLFVHSHSRYIASYAHRVCFCSKCFTIFTDYFG